jgi:hypothetical protein
MKPRILVSSLTAATLLALGAWGGIEANGKWMEARAQGAPAATAPAPVQAVPNFSAIVEAN